MINTTSVSFMFYEEDLEDLGYNADLHVFNDQTAQGFRGININNNTNINLN